MGRGPFCLWNQPIGLNMRILVRKVQLVGVGAFTP